MPLRFRFALPVALAIALNATHAVAQLYWDAPDPGCVATQSWYMQTNVETDTLGIRNIN
jgi:hypothetical protein